MRKSVLFDSWHQWKVCFLAGCKEFWWGFARIISCLILGVLSIIRWLWQLLLKAISLYPAAAVIVMVILCACIWLFTYVNGKAKLVSAENERDTMAYRLQKFEKMYDGNTDSLIIVRKPTSDTISFEKEYNSVNYGL